MKAHQSTIGLNDEWLTPPEILSKLGHFHLDPCSPVNPPWQIADSFFAEGGLEKSWYGRVFCNPPFNRYARPKWMQKMANHGDGILLVPAATETNAFRAYVWNWAFAVCFLYGRPHFHYVDGSRAKANCGCSIALVAYGQYNAEVLQNSGLGRTVTL